jgi:uncharacterized membrane protein YoaK (UPF0700 family)
VTTTPSSITLRFALLLSLTNGFLDAHTYLSRGGVFTNIHTANVIFAAINLTAGHYGAAMRRVWPILAFLAGVYLSAHLRSGRAETFLRHPTRWTLAGQAAALGVIGFVPASVHYSFVTVPISFLAAMQMHMFRRIGELPYMGVAATGNMMRAIEAGYAAFVEKDSPARTAVVVYGGVTAMFAGGAVIGALASRAWGVHAIWFPAGFLALMLAVFVYEERQGNLA